MKGGGESFALVKKKKEREREREGKREAGPIEEEDHLLCVTGGQLN